MNTSWYEENRININDSVGIDEVGRGPLAGPVISAAVWVSERIAQLLEHERLPVRDSKKMSHSQRAKVIEWIETQPPELIRYSIGCATVEEIDKINILNASLLSMERAYSSLGLNKKYVLVDGNRAPDIKDVSIKTIIKGDDKVLSISLSSILAKEYRDNLMKALALEYPYYKWETNAGYGSQAHLYAILQYGITPHHRKTFAPIKDLASCT